jgi:hypothetical protein
MNRFRAWAVAAVLGALGAGAVAPTLAADPLTATTTDDRPLYKRLFFKPSPQTNPLVSTGPIVAAPGTMLTGSALPAEVVNDAVQAEVAAWQRRMAVCLKLRSAAADRNDEVLERQVAELERQINALYVQRVTALGVPKTKLAVPAQPASAFAGSLDLAPEKPPVDPKTAASRLTAPAQPVPTGTAGLQPVPGAREVNP